jgi:phosphoribosylamine--glycine ligase
VRVLIIGQGAREAALAWRLSAEGAEVFVAPGNDGMRTFAHVVERADTPLDAARQVRPGLVVVGPEAPLAAGLVDELRALGILAFGPTRAAARIEASKLFAKDVMRLAAVPTLPAQLLTDEGAAGRYVEVAGGRAVLKADGLLQGKGAVPVEGVEAARQAYRWLAAAGGPVYAERWLEGREVSLFALTDGEHVRLLPAARDFKRAFDGDRGPNTGGMGAVAPVLTPSEAESLGERIVRPVLAALRRAGTPFVGCLYAGLMLTEEGPFVLEFNCRLGDPETAAVLPLLADPLLPLLADAAAGGLADGPPLATTGYAATVVVAARGYPEAPQADVRVAGLEPVVGGDVLVFWAHVRRHGRDLALSTGGRLAAVTGIGATPAAAEEAAYRRLAEVRSAEAFWRRDIRF